MRRLSFSVHLSASATRHLTEFCNAGIPYLLNCARHKRRLSSRVYEMLEYSMKHLAGTCPISNGIR